jgi:hypothetical protein
MVDRKMNENIRRLLAQAYLEQADIRDTTKIAEQFAELIVKECLDNCMAANDRDRIREHFGVEL